ncbi:MAG TPA: hypothetical protein VF778_13790 [Xanthobacteraceae bacterium]
MLDRKAVDRVVDVASVALISITAVLSALCGYQSGRWGETQSRLYNVANADRVRGAEATGRGNALTIIDVTLFLDYINAVADGRTREAEFINRRFRPEMRPAMDAWLATKPLTNPKAPTSPFVMPQYTLHTTSEARNDAKVAAASFQSAQEAARHADDFLLLTVVFAGVSFLAGMSTKFVFPRHAIVVAFGTLVLVYGIIRLVRLPFL